MSENRPIRDALLGVEPLNPQMRERFEQQVQDIYTSRITRRARLYWWLFLAACVVGAAGSAYNLITTPRQPNLWFNLFALAAWLASGVIVACVLARGRVDFLKQLAAGKFVSAVAFLILMVSFAYAMTDPRRPEAVVYGVYSLGLFMFVSGINLWNRIVAADYHSQEHMLRLEYRLADLASRVPPSEPAPGSTR